MKLITGFFMAWGNFLTLPCPLKRWDGDLHNYMLGFLPSVGLIIGLLWAGLAYLAAWLGLPVLLAAFVLTLLPFALCGFMHLDGFMDCCDAILSRRPLEERQRILKDSHTGAFAVVSVVFLLLGFFAAMASVLYEGWWETMRIGASFSRCLPFVLIPVVSRAVSGIHVLLCRPLGHSQYAKGEGAANLPQKKKAVVLVLVQLILYGALTLGFAASAAECLIVGLTDALGTLLAISWGRRQLGGMSGDIAGCGIVFGEFCAACALALV